MEHVRVGPALWHDSRHIQGRQLCAALSVRRGGSRRHQRRCQQASHPRMAHSQGIGRFYLYSEHLRFCHGLK